ncbi:hypothetical protein BV22DRAFT_1120038 [Leucogyrophana mollusca]|uniref:Uncharacterized protein n=1 Tax=Leucogyrophana mollusca TaxID=85980 RepID=A0ACB8BIP1_9AGAM|nr:hypothetical protein BV22DRAFT_1120038 [Leucogyrophana mollusca]
MNSSSPNPQQNAALHGSKSVTTELPPKYPPFPTVPEGAVIIPFKDFAPSGYRRIASASGDGSEIEVDGYGIPTVKVVSEEEARQRSKDRKRRRNAGQSTDANGRIVPWWEEWEEGESTRTSSYPSKLNTSYVDRVHQAADDFRVGRTWPPISSGVRTIWDQFRIYIGLLATLPIYRKAKSGSKRGVDISYDVTADASSDDDVAPKASLTTSNIVQDPLEQIAHPGKQLEPDDEKSDFRVSLLKAFIDDMEKSIQIFLSSYMRDKGLVWSERNLFIAPTVLHFFLRFMLRNDVFEGSPPHIDNLRRAIAITELAKTELPLTAQIGQLLPDKLGAACKECWGTQGNLSVQISVSAPIAVDAVTEGEGKPRVNDESISFEEELKAEGGVEVISSDVVLDSVTAKQVLEDNIGENAEIHADGWSFDEQDRIPGDPWTAAVTMEEYSTSSWTAAAVHTLIELMGPTLLPLTHATGVTEYSTRRIREVIPASVDPVASTGELTAVEKELHTRFACVVMEPWLRSPDEEGLDITKPVITVSGEHIALEEQDVQAADSKGRPVFNPYADDINLLIDPSITEHLTPGMGLCGSWVQIVRQQAWNAETRDHVEKSVEACGVAESYWYMEALISIFPSFYMELERIEPSEAGVSEDS